jgi:D-inositol-3-phosphate glycosyltransferase
MSTDCVPPGVCAPQTQTDQARVVLISLHTSPLAQAGGRDAGGLNVYVNELSRSLADSGVAVDIITSDADAEQPLSKDRITRLADGRRVHTLAVGEETRRDKSKLLDRLDVLTDRALRSLDAVDLSRITTVHSHYWISGLAGIKIARAVAAPLVHTMHTIAAVKQERDPESQESPHRSIAENMIAREADMVTANTDREVSDLKRLFGLSEDQIALVRPGVDLSVFHPPVEADPRLGPMDGRPLRLAFAGRLQPHKGPQVAVEALGAFRRSMPEVPVELVVAGSQSGDGVLDLSLLAEAMGVRDSVHALPPLPHSELADLFRRSDAVLMPSYSESFGLVALEAQACGTPVVATRVGGLSRAIFHGRTGLLVDGHHAADWADALEALYDDPVTREDMGRAAAIRAQNSGWQRTAAITLESYHAAVDNSVRPHLITALPAS